MPALIKGLKKILKSDFRRINRLAILSVHNDVQSNTLLFRLRHPNELKPFNARHPLQHIPQRSAKHFSATRLQGGANRALRFLGNYEGFLKHLWRTMPSKRIREIQFKSPLGTVVHHHLNSFHALARIVNLTTQHTFTRFAPLRTLNDVSG